MTYSAWKMLQFAWTAVSSFSALPLRLSMAAEATCGGFLYLRWVHHFVFSHKLVPGWACIVTRQRIFSGMILLALIAIGDYVARIYEESKGGPLYVAASAVNCQIPHDETLGASVLLVAEKKPIPAARVTA